MILDNHPESQCLYALQTGTSTTWLAGAWWEFRELIQVMFSAWSTAGTYLLVTSSCRNYAVAIINNNTVINHRVHPLRIFMKES